MLVAVTLGLLWPLLSSRRTLPNGDLLAHAWGLAWVDRQLGRDPLRLYDANIYFPEPRSLPMWVARTREVFSPEVFGHALGNRLS